MKPSEIPDAELEATFERMREADRTPERLEALERQVRMLMECTRLLMNAENIRIERRKGNLQ